MDSGKVRSESCGAKMGEIASGFHQFSEEVLSITTSEAGSSFTALLGLPANQAVELLVHSPETGKMESDKLTEPHTPYYHYPPPTPVPAQIQTPSFPSDIALIDKASKFSVFASAFGNSPESNSTLSNSGSKAVLVKQEPADSEFNQNSSPATSVPIGNLKSMKRKEREKKISGTAMVLDEIINHVQSLQQQVEFLSMKLAAVNPRVYFNLDSLFAAERNDSHVESNLQDMVVPPIWADGQIGGNRNQYQHLWHFEGFHQPVWGRLEDNSSFVTPENSLLTCDSSANSASLHPNQLKMEL
ncbi:unnamed protein product [Withania somnifera]